MNAPFHSLSQQLGHVCAALLLSIAATGQTPSATIEQVQLFEHEIDDLGVDRLNVGVRFSIRDVPAGTHRVEVLFARHSGKRLRDTNDQFRDANGKVAVTRSFESTGQATQNHADFELGIPYDELHLPYGEHRLLATVRIIQLNPNRKLLATAPAEAFLYQRRPDPSATIHRTWLEHDVRQGGELGMRLHIDVTVHHLEGIETRFTSYFFDANGKQLKDKNGQYRTSRGNVSVATSGVPGSARHRFHDAVAFLPYAELHLPSGTYSLSCDTDVYDSRETDCSLACSERIKFVRKN